MFFKLIRRLVIFWKVSAIKEKPGEPLRVTKTIIPDGHTPKKNLTLSTPDSRELIISEPAPGQNLRRTIKAGKIIGIAITSIAAIMVLIQILASIFLWKLRNWARFIIIVFSAFMLPSFPIGTAIGLYSFWVLLFREHAADYFGSYEAMKVIED